MSNLVLSPASINVSKIEFGAPVALNSGGFVVNVKYNGNPLRVETPTLTIPYGLSDGYVAKGATRSGPPKYSVGFSFSGADDNPEIQALQDFIRSLDERLLEAAIENSKKWFKKDSLSLEVVKDKYTPMEKYSKDPEGNIKPYPPTLNASLRQNKGATGKTVGDFQVDFYNPEIRDEKNHPTKFPSNTEVDTLLCKRGKARNILEFAGVWLINGKFNATWRLIQARIDARSEGLTGPAFSDDNTTNTKVKVNHVQDPTSKAITTNKYEDDGDDNDKYEDDGDAEEIIQPKAAPAPAPASAPAPAPSAPVFEDDDVSEPVPVPKVHKMKVKKPAAVAAK